MINEGGTAYKRPLPETAEGFYYAVKTARTNHCREKAKHSHNRRRLAEQSSQEENAYEQRTGKNL